MRDVEPGALRRDASSAATAPRAPDPHAARLFTALQIRPGHALVVGEQAVAADELFGTVDAQLACFRRLRVRGRGLNPEAVVRTIGADFATGDPPPSLDDILSALAAEARAAAVPVVVAITGAEEAGARTLNRLRALLEATPETRDLFRLVLLGGPRLITVLTQPEARELSARLLTKIYLPPSEMRAVIELPEPIAEWPSWARVRRGLALALAGMAFLIWWTTHGYSPVTPSHVTPVAKPTPFEAVSEAPAPPPAPDVVATPEAPAAAPAAPAPTSTARTRQRASLQVGSFVVAENAEALRARLAQDFDDVEVVATTREGIRYQTVRVRAADEHQLTARAAALRDAGYSPVRVRD